MRWSRLYDFTAGQFKKGIEAIVILINFPFLEGFKLWLVLGAICDVMASNEHAGLLEGRESLYPKLRQYLRSIYMGWITESEKFTPPELIPQRWAHESLSGWKKELEFSTSHDIKGYPKMQERFRWRSS